MQEEKKTRLLKWVLIVSIVIVANLFINYAVFLVYPSPEWETFCPTKQVVEPIKTEEACLALGGQWNVGAKEGYTEKYDYGYKDVTRENPGYCNETYTCANQFEEARKDYERNVFISLVIAGILLVVGSFFARMNFVLKTSLSLAGVLSFIVASMRYWSSAQDWLRVLILGIALVTLITLAVRKFKD